MKRIIGVILCSFIACAGALHSLAATETVNGITWTYTVSNGKASLGMWSTSGAVPKSTQGAITIPASFGEYPVTSIGYGAFYNCSGLTSVTIPDSVTSIGGYAFYGCSGLTSATIPDSVTSIEACAFRNCNGLTSVTIPDSVTSIGGYTFEGCDGLTSVTIPDSVTNIGSSAFEGCSGLTSMTIGNGVTSIGSSAFEGCSGLTSVTIPNSVTSIGYSAFSGCSGLASVTIGNSVTSIGDYAFSGCSDSLFDTATIPGVKLVDGWAVGTTGSLSGNLDLTGVRGFGNRAFSGRSGLTSVTIPDSVTSIGSWAFSGCSGLTSVTIPDSVKSIGGYTFRNCSGLTSVTIPDSVTSIGGYTFEGCSGLTSVTIPDSVKSIEYGAFSGCSGLTSVTIPDSVTSIGERAFDGCSGLEDIKLPFVGACRDNTGSPASLFGYIFGTSSFTGSTETRQYYSSADYERFYIPTCLKKVVVTDETELGYGTFYNCSGLTSVTMPDSVTNIGSYAFYNCSGLTNVTIPDSMTSIGSSAFEGCSGLTSVTIPDSVTSIGSSAFEGCSGLTSMTIGNGVTSIGSSAFYDCRGLTSVTIPDSVKSIGNGAFSGCSGLKDATIPQKVCDWGMSYVFPSAYKTITNVVISESATSIGSSAFYGCKGLTGVAIPDSVTNIADYAFADCTNLQTEVQGGYKVINGWVVGYTDEAEETIPDADNLKGICSEALMGCTALKRLEFGDRARLVSIGAEALKGCTELKTLVLPPSLTRIGNEAFMGCSYLDDVIVPGGVKSVGARAFKNCTGFTYAQIEHGVESIGEEAFCGCWRITEVDIPSSVSSIGQNAFGGDSSIIKVALRGDIRQMSQIFANYQSIREATVKTGRGSLVDGLFGGCSSLETVRFLGDCPALVNNGANLYQNENWSLVTYVSKDSTGWDGTAGSHTLPMAWPLVGSYRRSIMYVDDISAPHAVAFDANGGTPKTQNVEQRSETPFVLPKEPTRAGYTFAGWWTEKNGGVKVTSGTVFIEGVYSHLYAHWIKPGQVSLEIMFSGTGKVSLDENGNIVVVLTVDVSGTVEIPDNVGAVIIDLNGHDMVGGGGLGETALPGPAILIVAGEGEGNTTQLTIVDTSEGEKGQIAGGGESAGIEVADDVVTGVGFDVEDGVGVFNGDGSEQELKPKLIGTGKVTVPKTWKTGQKVTWKATADKGSVFARWEGPLVDSVNLTKNERRNPSLAFAVPEGFDTNMVTAVFIPIDDDGLYSLGITQTEFELNGQSQNSAAGGHAGRVTLPEVLLDKGVATNLWVTDDSQSYVTATASGLPSGLKFDAKKMCITGAPTKGGVYWVQIKAKNASGYQWAENVKVTVSGDGKEAKEPKLTRTAYYPLTVICATEGGTVSGTGVYAEGKKVTIKATPAKGYVFAGWYATAAEAKGGGRGATALPDDGHAGRVTLPDDGHAGRATLPLAASMSVTVPEMRYVFAKFVTVEEDRDSIGLAVNGEELRRDGVIAPYRTNIWAGVYMEWPVAASALSETKVKVAGLPSGLKFTEKDIMKKGSKTEVEIPANTIYGAPTAASKERSDGGIAPYQVKITVTTAGKSSQTYQIDTFVEALPEWAAGTFEGVATGGTAVSAVQNGRDAHSPSANGRDATPARASPSATRAGPCGRFAVRALRSADLTTSSQAHPARGIRSPSGVVSLTIAANGKISGKLIDADGTWTLSAPWFDGETGTRDACPYQDMEAGSPMSDVGSPVFVATVIGKNGKMAFTNEMEVAAEDGVGVVNGRDATPARASPSATRCARGIRSPSETGETPPLLGHRLRRLATLGGYVLPVWTAWQNLWKAEPWKSEAKAFAKAPALAIDAGTRDACPYPGTITLKFAASGAVTASGKFVTGQDAKGKDVVYSASCKGVLIPGGDGGRGATALPDAAVAGHTPYRIFLYFPPKAGKFDGFCAEIPLVWDGAAFAINSIMEE